MADGRVRSRSEDRMVKIHGEKKDSNIWIETSQKQKAGLEKEGALKKGSGRSWFNRGRLSQTKGSLMKAPFFLFQFIYSIFNSIENQ